MFSSFSSRVLLAVFTLIRSNLAESAFDVYTQKRKQINLKLTSKTSYSKKHFLGINWFVNYKKKKDGENEDKDEFDPLVRLVAVTRDGVYLKRFEVPWFEINEHLKKNTDINPVLSTVGHNPITSYHMNDNQTTLVVAFKNLTVLTLNLSVPDHPTRFVVSSFDARYKYLEGDEEIRSIGRIPYSDLILLSPGRFEFFKIDIRTRSKIYKKRSPLDRIGYIVTPLPTHNPLEDPHNPKKRKDPTLNPRIVKKTELTYFIATGHNSSTNALIDWTTMKVINYWTMLDREDRVRTEDWKLAVTSICFFGGSPRGQLYLMMGSDLVSKLYFFISSNRNVVDSEPLPKVSSRGQVSWINGTYFVYILQEGLINQPSHAIGSYFLNLGPFIHRKIRFIDKYHSSLQIGVRYDYANLMTFSMKIGNKDDLYDGFYKNLDSFYYILYKNENSIEVRIPPFNWDLCHQDEFNPSRINYKMYSGRYMDCGTDDCQGGFQKRADLSREAETYIQCRRKTCESGKILHVYSSSGKLKDYCRTKQTLKEAEKALSNDNGCKVGYNLDHFGMCRRCKKVKYRDDTFEYYPSDCLLWLNFEDLLLEDTSTYNYFEYTEEKYDQDFHYKGMKGNEHHYKDLFWEKKISEDLGYKYFGSTVAFTQKTLIREMRAPKLLKQCYFTIRNLKKSPDYDLLPAEGYYLDFLENDPTGQAMSQRGIYGDKTLLNTYYCRKNCPQGYFYDFDSISCRRCGFGCAECQKFSECDSCEPGFTKYSRARFSTHRVDHLDVSQCHIGCQDGFYLKGFKGTCHECDEDCLECVDSLFILKENYDNKTSPKSFCIKCASNKQGSGSGKGLIINAETGQCEKSCEGSPGLRLKNKTIFGNRRVELCYRCQGGCLECELHGKRPCLKCEKNLFLSEDGLCLEWFQVGIFLIGVSTAVTASGLIIIFLLILFVYRICLGVGSPTEEKDALFERRKRSRRFKTVHLGASQAKVKNIRSNRKSATNVII